MDKLIIRGARVHNLKNVDLELPKNKLSVFTGLSGSGKSSLAFDTIYAEGQRRYVESLSSYARQFLGVMDKPDVDSIEGLSPAISIDQKTTSHNPRSTVGTITEIYDYLRLFFARVGHPHCPVCGREIASQSSQQIVERIMELLRAESEKNKKARFLLLAPVVRDRKGEFSQLLDFLRQKGFIRARIDKRVMRLDQDFGLIKSNKHTIEAVVDRLSLEEKQLKSAISLSNLKTRLTDSVETALNLTDGLMIACLVEDASFDFPENPQKLRDYLFSQKFACPDCNISLSEIEPRTFSFNSPHGACPNCHGLGTLLKIDPGLVVNPKLSVAEGGILPFSRIGESDSWWGKILTTIAAQDGFSLFSPISKLKPNDLKKILYGTGERTIRVNGVNRKGQKFDFETTFEGVIPNLERRYRETDSEYMRTEIGRYMRKEICPICQGSRLKKESLSITVDGFSIAQVSAFQIKRIFIWLTELRDSLIKLSQKEKVIAQPILKDLLSRLSFLLAVGLEYLSIDREAESLAGGEAQRIRLASQIGSGLSGVLYVLDEPTIGLHSRDNQRLINTLKALRDLGNTVIVVEHDREMMEQADLIVDFGPGAGEEGGKVVAMGTPEEIKKNPLSLTGKYLSGKEKIEIISAKSHDDGFLTIKGCSQFNLKNIDVAFPLGKFICVTGVSGSGKSTLVNETLYRALMSKTRGGFLKRPGKYKSIEGSENIDQILLIDQSPIGRTPRSNPATYTGVFNFIRDLFSLTSEAKIRGYKPGRFSFNIPGGRCDECRGDGQIKIEMQFLPDIYVTCEICHGNRYNSETLEITYKGKNISEILNMSIDESGELFKHIPGLANRLETLKEVGLGYLKLGQSSPTLSGGEAQRIKLSRQLGKRPFGKTLYLLDEPTTGLHFADLKKLLVVLKKLVEKGNTVIVIEHNLDVIKNADWIIDLGLEGGDGGGEVVVCGPPAQVAKNQRSWTGKFLKKVL